MKKLAFAFVAATALGFAAPAVAASATPISSDGIATAQTDLSAQRREVRRVIIRRGPGWRRGWGGPGRVVKKTVIRRGPMGRTVIRERIR